MRWAVNDDSAVSETIGYILIFMIVLTCIAFILLVGNGLLDTTKAQNNFKSMEQGLAVVSSDMKQVALEGTPVKTTRIHMEGGSISAKEDTNAITITVDGAPIYNNINTGNIMFRSDKDNSIVSLENGGLWEKQGVNAGNIVVLKPRIYTTVDPVTNVRTLVLNIIRLDTASPSSVGGSATMDIMLEDKGTNVFSYPYATVKDVVITFYTDYPDAWSRFFEENGAINLVVNTDSVTVTFPIISKLIISEHMVGATIV